jgi:hypothetical protein
VILSFYCDLFFTHITEPQGPPLSVLTVAQPQVSHSAKLTHVSAHVKSPPSVVEQVYVKSEVVLDAMGFKGKFDSSLISVDAAVKSSC